ncbi:MAG: hypothetical protein K6F56_04600 [Oscillospiraceae bacterium]|nr:hypothetical protein [Oscillospiraceae bacterium]
MKRQRIDYSGFRLSRINEPQFRHLKLLWGWVFYFVMYFLTENLIPPERCHVMHCALDDLIPFNEFFLIFYAGWYFLVLGFVLYYLLYDAEQFSRLQVFIIVTQVVAMAIYIIWPSRQDLRPAVFPRQNILTALMGYIYSFDTSTGVCPSLHVAYSLGILSVGLKDRFMPVWGKALLTFFVLMVCVAVCFVKQHSVLDVLAALPVCLLAEYLTFHVVFPDKTKA